MAAYHEYLINMPDGTIKQINPLTGTEVWSVPGRGARPLANGTATSLPPLPRCEPENYCDFCPTQYQKTPPEKARLVCMPDGECTMDSYLDIEQAATTPWTFRRVANLFEIVSLEYWRQNFGYNPDAELQQWRESYLATSAGRDHVLAVMDYKLQLQGYAATSIATMSADEKLARSASFFGGSHELILARRHFLPGDGPATALAGSGDLTPDEHLAYLRFTLAAMTDIYRHNRYVRYVAVFQNWLRPAGASFEHLHRQLVGLDEWGTALEWEISRLRQNPNIYNELLANFAAHTNRVVAENDHAIAFVAIGHRFPTLAVYSKSAAAHPHLLSADEVQGMSDLIHAMHATVGREVSSNEEWYYTPRDSVDTVPWHVLLKLRVNTPAGFEGGTRIYINPFTPFELRDMIVPRLYALRYEKRIRVKWIAEECPVQPNSLRYVREVDSES